MECFFDLCSFEESDGCFSPVHDNESVYFCGFEHVFEDVEDEGLVASVEPRVDWFWWFYAPDAEVCFSLV